MFGKEVHDEHVRVLFSKNTAVRQSYKTVIGYTLPKDAQIEISKTDDYSIFIKYVELQIAVE